MAKPVVKRSYTATERVYLIEILKGMALTLRHLVFNVGASFRPGPHTIPTTWQYPEDRREISPIFRGAHMFLLDEKGREQCVGCGMCAKACPAKCITVTRGKVEEGQEDRYAGKTYCADFQVDLLRCIFCGICEETCPKGALALGPEYELARYTPEECQLKKEGMLANYRKAKAEGGIHRPLKPVPVEGAGEAPPKEAAEGAEPAAGGAKAAGKKVAAKPAAGAAAAAKKAAAAKAAGGKGGEAPPKAAAKAPSEKEGKPEPSGSE